jgi:hypothetical protein
MKYYLFTILFIVSLIINAQEKPGSIVFSGNVNYLDQRNEVTYATYYKEDNYNLFINPKIGFYISKNLIFGFGGGIQKIKNIETGQANQVHYEDRTNYNIKFFNIFFNALKPINEKISFNLNIELKNGKGESTHKTYNNGRLSTNLDGELSEKEFSLQPGLLIKLTKRLGISANYGRLIRYSNEENLINDNDPNSRLRVTNKNTILDLGSESFRLGFMFVFSGNKKS